MSISKRNEERFIGLLIPLLCVCYYSSYIRNDGMLLSRMSCLWSEAGEDEYNIACLLMVFIAVAIPKLSRSEFSVYRAALEGESVWSICLLSIGLFKMKE